MSDTNEKEWWGKEADSVLLSMECDCLDGWCKHVSQIKSLIAEVERRTIEKVEEIIKNIEPACDSCERSYISPKELSSKLRELKK